jgi:DNA-binding NtrC family response regulator
VSLDDLEKFIESRQKGRSTDRPIVLVIDDDRGIRQALARVLKAKYEVLLCADGAQGVRETDKSTSCVILDVRMPTHNGFWVCKQLSKKAPDVPIIFHSAHQDAKGPREVINEFHPFGYVVKGEKIADLLALVARAVKHSERIKERDRRSTPVPARRSTSIPARRSTPVPARRSKPASGRPR